MQNYLKLVGKTYPKFTVDEHKRKHVINGNACQNEEKSVISFTWVLAKGVE